MSHKTLTDSAEELIDLYILRHGLRYADRRAVELTFVMTEHLKGGFPTRLSKSGHKLLNGLRDGTICPTAEQIAKVQGYMAESRRRDNLSDDERKAEAETARDGSHVPVPPTPREHGNHRRRRAPEPERQWVEVVGGRVVVRT